MTRGLLFLITALVCVPLNAKAQTPVEADPNCVNARALRGDVKTVLISKGSPASPRKPELEARWEISRDRRTVQVIDYRPDESPLSWLVRPFGFYTTTICDFDSSGRFVRSRLKLNGLTTFLTVEVRYDGQGREVEAKSWSTDGGSDNVATYEYSGNTVTERSLRTLPITRTIERDNAGRIRREITHDSRLPVSDVEFSYGPDVVETLSHAANGTIERRSTARLDFLGNTIEVTSPLGKTTLRYEYDPQGNWTRRVTDGSLKVSSTPTWNASEVEIRDLSIDYERLGLTAPTSCLARRSNVVTMSTSVKSASPM